MIVEKRMALTLREFQATLAPLVGRLLESGESAATLAVGGGLVVISHAALPPVLLGGLLEMPQALVTLQFQGVCEADRDDFVRRFDLYFRRGGG
jgi:hypothetical protein